MTLRTIRITRIIAFSPAIVWDGLIDPDLVSGWLGDARIDPIIGGRYDLAWLVTPEVSATSGRILTLDPTDRLEVATDAHGTVDFSLKEVSGGPRGTSTELTIAISVDIEAPFAARVQRLWSDGLDGLDALLHGHPVDWGIVASGPDADAAELDVAVTTAPFAARRTGSPHTNAIETDL